MRRVGGVCKGRGYGVRGIGGFGLNSVGLNSSQKSKKVFRRELPMSWALLRTVARTESRTKISFFLPNPRYSFFFYELRFYCLQ